MHEFSEEKWTKMMTEYRPCTGKRHTGRSSMRWDDAIYKIAGILWRREAMSRGK